MATQRRYKLSREPIRRALRDARAFNLATILPGVDNGVVWLLETAVPLSANKAAALDHNMKGVGYVFFDEIEV